MHRAGTNKGVLATAVICALVFYGCGVRPAVDRPHVVLICLDTLRADRLPAYGYSLLETPAIDGLARDGVLFERAFSQYPLTLPSHATMFTGKLPGAHGIRENGSYLKEGMETLAGVLAENGYETAGFVSSMVLRESTGIAQGFGSYEDGIASEEGDILAERPGEETVRLACDWLSERGSRPFFLFLHLYDPHTPYRAPEPFASQYGHPYDAEIARTDANVATFIARLKELDLYNDALILLLSDHGEGLGDHGEDGHGIFVYREVVRVPLIVKLPGGAEAGQREKAPVGLMDIKPTVEYFAGIDGEKGLGRKLFFDSLPMDRPIYSESYLPLISYGWSPLRSVIQRQYHHIQAPRPELYDLFQDPGERKNLLPAAPVPNTMTEFLAAIEEGETVQAELSPEETALLESLGYVGRTTHTEGFETRDAKDFIHQLQALEKGRALRDAGDFEQAEKVLRQLLNENPQMANARSTLGAILDRQGKWSDLEALYEDGLRLDPANIHLMETLTAVKLRLGKANEAKTLAQVIHARDTKDANDKLSHLFYYYGDTEFGLKLARETLAGENDRGYSSFVLGSYLAARQSCEEAEPYLQKAGNLLAQKRAVEFAASSFFQLGKCRQTAGRMQPAETAYRRVLETHPQHLETRVALAMLYGSQQRRIDAIRILDEWVADFPSRTAYLTAAKTMEALAYRDAAEFYRGEALKYPSEPDAERR